MPSFKKGKDDEEEKISAGQNRRQEDGDEDEGGESPRGVRAAVKRAQDLVQTRRTLATALATTMTALGLGCLIIALSIFAIELKRPTEEMAIHALDFGAFENARQYSKSILRFAKENEKAKIAAANFVFGVATCELLDQSKVRDKKPFYKDAADALAKSQTLGFVAGREADGYFYLGKSQFECQDYSDAVKNLETALPQNPSREKNIAWYLANAYDSLSQPNHEKSLAYLQRFDELPPAIKAEQQNAAMLRTFIYIKQERVDDAESEIEKVPNTPFFVVRREFALGKIAMIQSENFLLNANRLERSTQIGVPEEEIRLLEKELKKTPIPKQETQISKFLPNRKNVVSPHSTLYTLHSTLIKVVYVREENNSNANGTETPNTLPQESLTKENIIQAWRVLSKNRLENAVEHFENVKSRDTDLLEWYRKAAVQEAMCYEKLGKFDRAQQEYKAVAKTFPGTPEAITAEFFWSHIEYIVNHNLQDGAAALEHSLELLEEYNKGKKDADKITMNSMMQLGEKEIQRFIDEKQYAKAEEVLMNFRVIPEESRSRLFSTIYSRWGDQLVERAEGKPLAEQRTILADAQKKYQLAGKWYKTLSQWTFTSPEYLTNIWNSADFLRKGRDFPQSILMYRKFLENDILTRQALAHYYIGSMLFEMDAVDEAIRELENTLTAYPNDAAEEEIRLMLVYAVEEKKEWQRAVDLLTLNLNGKYAPDSDVYRDSLYELGCVYGKMDNNDKAAETLENVITLYPNDKRVASSHYLIAISELNKLNKLESQVDKYLLKHQQETTLQIMENLRRNALEHLQQARTLLLRQDEKIGLEQSDRRMLRNTFLLIGRLLDELGPEHYDEAVRENRNTIARYMSHPDVLQAYLQLAGVYQHQNNQENVKKTLSQAQILFQRFQSAKAFQQETIYSEQEWQKLLQVDESGKNLNR